MNQDDNDEVVKSLYSSEAEEAVLGCMLAYPAEVIEEMINFPLAKADFFVRGNGIIFDVLWKMYEDNEAIEVMTVHERLKVDRKDEEVGSPGILASLLVGFATQHNVTAYARIVRDKSILRTLREAAVGIVDDIAAAPDSVPAIINRAEEAINQVADSSFHNPDADFGMEIEEAALSIFEHADAGGGLRGLPTGFKKLDELTTGWNPGELIVIAAHPGKGKTGLALAFIKTLVEFRFNAETGLHDIPGEAVQMFSLEMTRQDLYLRFYAMKAGVGLSKIFDGDLSEGERQKIVTAQAAMRSWKIWIDDTPRMDIALIRSRARRASRKHKVAAIVVDYLQLCKSRNYPRDRQNEVADISGRLKQIARENSVPLIALAQLNRNDMEDDDKTPRVANIRDSGAIAQDADKIILLHEQKNRDTVQRPSENVKHYELILAKHRNGRQGRVEVDFEAWRVLFSEKRD